MPNNLVSLNGNFNFKEWVNDLNKSLSSYNIPLFNKEEEKWREWVMDFITLNPLYIITLPTQKTWKEWVTFFINDINTI